LWDTYNEDRAPGADIGRIVRIAVFAALGVIIFSIAGNQSVNLFMNVQEFGEVFTKPVYYTALSGVILAAITLVRVNSAARHSVTWYGIKMLVNFLKRGESQGVITRYSEFQMSRAGFALWQLTKVVFFAPLFANIMFGMAAEYLMQGNDLGLGAVGGIFAIPFADIPADGSYAQQNVVPAFPALTLLFPPLLAAVGLRLLMYVGISSTVNIISQYAVDSKESKPKFLSYISKIEIIAGMAIFWIGFNMFFSSNIDYNTRYAIAGTLTLGAAFIGYGFLDRRRARVIIYPNRRHVYVRLLTAAVVVGLAGSIMIVNGSIAGTKIELDGPYIVQQIEVNRYMHGLDDIKIVNYDSVQPTISASVIQSTVEQNSYVLGKIRLWDESNASARLTQELAQRNDLGYFDFDILRFDGSMYWTGTTIPLVPPNVAPENRWFSQHTKYTHSDVGMKMLDASSGIVVDESQFFNQRRIYYGENGEGGLFRTYWSAYEVDRTSSKELGGFFYNGTGGVDISPPLSWMFEPNFMVSYPGTSVHVMRYKDIHDRMELLYPYFVYQFCFGCTPTNPQPVDIEAFMVTDGKDTYWLMPLVVALNTSNVPWSSTASSGFMLQLVGYSLIDAYNGTVQIIATGGNYFSEMFLDQYADVGATRDVPEWLEGQIRYPEEMFIWQVSKFNTYHVTDPQTYIENKEVYAVAVDSDELAPVYAFAKPPGFESPEFVGIQLLQLKQPQSPNLVGYMVVQNDLENLGDMTLYLIHTDSPVKFINPKTAKSTLQGDSEFKEAKKETNPPIGETILYKVGDYEVYFIPVFADTSGKEISMVGAVGAASSTGSYHVGIGDNPHKAFGSYLEKLAGVSPPGQPPAGNQTALDLAGRIQDLEKVFTDAGLTVVKPTAVSVPVAFREAQATYVADSDLAQAQAAIRDFIEEFALQGGRIYEWQQDTTVNFGILRQIDGIVESHYISIVVG
jgi:uncharacterized membrane protein (UPF0182 family)